MTQLPSDRTANNEVSIRPDEALNVIENRTVLDCEPILGLSSHQHVEANVRLSNSPTTWQIAEGLLKSPNAVVSRTNLLAGLLAILIFAHLAYGVIVGSFAGDRQLLAAPIKIALGTVAAAFLCLPSLYVFACLSGATIRVREVAALLFGALALTSILLIGLAPVAFIFTFSTESLVVMGGIHLGIWLVAIGFGLRYLIRGVALLNGRDGWFVRIWAAVFVLCLLQMSTTLRPIIGNSDKLLTGEKRFFAQHWLEQVREPARRSALIEDSAVPD